MLRLTAILLLPYFVAGNFIALAHVATAHHSSGDVRAHFHLGSSSHHEHHHHDGHHHQHSADDDHDEPESELVNPVEHDSDAVYIAGSDGVYTASDRAPVNVDSTGIFESVDELVANVRPTIGQMRLSQSSSTGRPLYLLHAALRL